MKDLILASTSPYRRALLERLGVPFRVVAPSVDESSYKSRGLAPRSLAKILALQKATSVAKLEPNAVVIGSDQVAEVGGRILDKPGSVEAAVEQLLSLSGRSHRLITAVAVACVGKHTILQHTDVTTLWMRPLGVEVLRRYVVSDLPLDCAGSYKLESRGITLFERIESADQTAITGLPLLELTTMLRAQGFDVP